MEWGDAGGGSERSGKPKSAATARPLATASAPATAGQLLLLVD